MPGYFSRYNPDLLALIPPDAKNVLEIGCGEGALCEAYRRVNPGVEWEGWDVNGEALVVAKTRGVITFKADVSECRPIMDTNDFDVVVLGDVLEHLVDPLAVLQWVAAHVRPGAQVLASIPNVQHWTVIRDLIDGKWDYADEGLMDRTHLRFFTRKTIGEMFAAAGLHVFEMRGRDIGNEGFESWLAESGVRPRKEMRAYQYIARAVKPVVLYGADVSRADVKHIGVWNNTAGIAYFPPENLHIHAVTAEACCGRPRILEPFAMMATEPGVKCTTTDLLVPKIADVVILQRQRKMQYDYSELARHSVVIAELDDDPDGLQGYAENDYMQLRAVHAVQVSTEALAEIVRQYNPHVRVFPNQIAALPAFEPKDNHALTIFYGAQNRQADWEPIMPALNRVIREAGNSRMIWVHAIHDEAFYRAIDLPSSQKFFTPFCEYGKYREILRSCDIALLPLEPGRFNECKSDIKFLECAAEGVVVLASWTAYGEHIRNHAFREHRGVLYDSPEEFGLFLRMMIKNSAERTTNAQGAYAYVRDNRLLSQHYRTQLEWYRNLLKSKEALHRDLLERVPALGGQPQSAPQVLLA